MCNCPNRNCADQLAMIFEMLAQQRKAIENLSGRCNMNDHDATRHDDALTELYSQVVDLEGTVDKVAAAIVRIGEGWKQQDRRVIVEPEHTPALLSRCWCSVCGWQWVLISDGRYESTPCPKCFELFHLPPPLRPEDRPPL